MVVSLDGLIIGNQYTRPQLASLWGYQGWEAIGKGIVTPSGDNKMILFVTKEKQASLTQYQDEFIDGVLYMDGEKNHSTDGRLVLSPSSGDEIYLFYRERHHESFYYYGPVFLAEYHIFPDKPSRFVFCTSSLEAITLAALVTEVSTEHQNNEGESLDEGEEKLRQHKVFERNQKARAKAIQIHGTQCYACGFDFDMVYGNELARSYIEIHHLESVTKGPKKVDPAKDLIPLCSNCHRMVHKTRESILPLAELKNLIEQNA